MHEAVSDILSERAQITEGMSRMLLVSLAGHAVLIASLLFAPEFWSSSAVDIEKPMMIELGGAEGPDSGGMNTIAARPVQRVAEPEERVRPTPPAEKPPEMVAPAPAPKPAPKPSPKPVQKPAESSRTRKPAAGTEITSGSARAETGGAQIPFGGLTTGGGGTGGVRTNIENFCCPAYLTAILSQIRRNWNERQAVSGQNTIRFVIHRDGTISGVQVETSGGQLLDIASQRAILNTGRVSALPAEFTGTTLTIYLDFEYRRR